MMMLVVFTAFLGMERKTAVGTSTFIMTFTALIADMLRCLGVARLLHHPLRDGAAAHSIPYAHPFIILVLVEREPWYGRLFVERRPGEAGLGHNE